jgi:hypothetical protein
MQSKCTPASLRCEAGFIDPLDFERDFARAGDFLLSAFREVFRARARGASMRASILSMRSTRTR